MFDIKQDARMDIKEQLLYNIWQELKIMNQKSNNNYDNKSELTHTENPKKERGKK